MAEKRKLGRGLSALMGDVLPPEDGAKPADGPVRSAERVLPIEALKANPDQPRRDFDAEELQSLADSVAEKGIIQPILVREAGAGDYLIVAGERRWRAAQMAQLHEVPVIVRDYSDEEVLEIAIIENVQRADLNPVEEALGFRQLMDRFGHTQDQLAKALSKSRSHIANQLRLLNLPDGALEMLRTGQLTAGHARAVLACDNPMELANQIVRQGLSVREAERLSKAGAGEVKGKAAKAPGRAEKDADTVALEGDLSATLGMKVTIQHSDGSQGGALSIKYKNLDDLDRLCQLLSQYDKSAF